ncbi:hypothetical protein EON65_46085 [archaeon]|nr:MAG: hypothetical protein EON65_46085 [archaeon]
MTTIQAALSERARARDDWRAVLSLSEKIVEQSFVIGAHSFSCLAFMTHHLVYPPKQNLRTLSVRKISVIMTGFGCICLFLLFLCQLILKPEARDTLATAPIFCPIQFNVAFITMSQLWGSTVMRGLMLEQAVNANPSLCARAIVFPRSDNVAALTTFFADRTKLSVCIFVKTVYKHLVPVCEGANAFIFDDVVDNPQSAQDMVKHILLRKETLIHTPLYASYLVQSTFLADALMRINVSAYYYPHHHSNDFPEYTYSNASSTFIVGQSALPAPSSPSLSEVSTPPEPLVVGLLAGNRFNIPDLHLTILPGICAVPNTHFHVVNQRLRSTAEDPTAPSMVNSSVTMFSCQQDVEQKYYLNYTQFIYTSVAHPKDALKQLAYYMDDSLMPIDVGLVWTNKHIHPQNLYDFEMLRPPTRMLHWMSRGVPVIFFPTHSYVDVVRQHAYGKGVVADTKDGDGLNPEVGGILQATNTASLTRAVQILHDMKIRDQLSQHGTHIASRYSVDRIATRLMLIIAHHGVNCLCTTKNKGSGFVCQAQHNVQSTDIQKMCAKIRAYKAILMKQ